jgi:hypothetical protein
MDARHVQKQAMSAGYVRVLGHVAVVAGQRERVSVVGAGLPLIASCLRELAETVERLGLVGMPGGVAGQGQRVLEVAGGLLELAQPRLGPAEVAERDRFAVPVADLPVQAQGQLMIASGLLAAPVGGSGREGL